MDDKWTLHVSNERSFADQAADTGEQTFAYQTPDTGEQTFAKEEIIYPDTWGRWIFY